MGNWSVWLKKKRKKNVTHVLPQGLKWVSGEEPRAHLNRPGLGVRFLQRPRVKEGTSERAVILFQLHVHSWRNERMSKISRSTIAASSLTEASRKLTGSKKKLSKDSSNRRMSSYVWSGTGCTIRGWRRIIRLAVVTWSKNDSNLPGVFIGTREARSPGTAISISGKGWERGGEIRSWSGETV